MFFRLSHPSPSISSLPFRQTTTFTPLPLPLPLSLSLSLPHRYPLLTLPYPQLTTFTTQINCPQASQVCCNPTGGSGANVPGQDSAASSSSSGILGGLLGGLLGGGALDGVGEVLDLRSALTCAVSLIGDGPCSQTTVCCSNTGPGVSFYFPLHSFPLLSVSLDWIGLAWLGFFEGGVEEEYGR